MEVLTALKQSSRLEEHPMSKAERWSAVALVCTVVAVVGCGGASSEGTGGAPRASTRPSGGPATRGAAADASSGSVRGLDIKYTWGGDITGKFNTVRIATPDVAIPDGERAGVTRVSGERAEAIVKLLRRAGVMDWPAGIRGRGHWNDTPHYFLDVAMDGKTQAIHAAGGDPSAGEAQRVQALMKK